MSNYSNGYYRDASRGGAYQPINYIISQTAASNGTATFLFDAVALSNTWTFTINCAGAPDTAIFVASSGGTTFGQFKGSNSWGPLQLQGGDRLQVTASGLVPGTNYQFAGYGYANVVNEPEIVYPIAYADSVTTSTEQIYLGSSFVASIGSTTPVTIATIPISSTYRSIYILGTTAAATNVLRLCDFDATGNVTKFVYQGVVLPYASDKTQVAVRIPNIASADTMFTLTVTAPSGSSVVNATFYYGGDLANVDTAVYPEGTFDVTVANTSTQPIPIQGSGSGTAVAITPGDTIYTPLYVQVIGGTLTSVTMGGDVTGQSNSATVVGLEGKLINGTATTAGQVLVYTGSLWTNTASTGYSSTGNIVMDQSPTITTPTLSGNTTAGTINSTTIPASSTLITTSTIASNAVSSINGGTTGLTPSTATQGAVTLAGTLNVVNGGTGVTTSTGTGSVVLSSSPTLVTPALGTPSSAVLTNATGLPLTTGVTGTLPVANGGAFPNASTGSLPASFWNANATYQTVDPNLLSLSPGPYSPTKGVVYYYAIYLPAGISPSKIVYNIQTAGTSASCLAGLYNSTTQIGYTGTGVTTVGSTTLTLTATSAGSLTSLAGGVYFIGFLIINTSTTSPYILATSTYGAPASNFGPVVTAGSLTTQVSKLGTGLNALPASISGTPTTVSIGLQWLGIS